MPIGISTGIARFTALAALLASASAASAQGDPPTSERRIRMQKESAGEVVRRDSAAAAESVFHPCSARCPLLPHRCGYGWPGAGARESGHGVIDSEPSGPFGQ